MAAMKTKKAAVKKKKLIAATKALKAKSNVARTSKATAPLAKKTDKSKDRKDKMRASSTAEVKALRDEAIARAASGAGLEWMDRMELILIDVCKAKPWFTSDDIATLAAERGIEPPDDLRAMGAVMTNAARNFLCEKEMGVASVPSNRKTLHGSPRAVWRSLFLLKRQAELSESKTKTIWDTVKTPIGEFLAL